MVEAIARTGNLTRAAEKLSVTPSALSHRLGEAERRIGRRLFEREGRRVILTPAGQTILRSAEQALALVAQAEADVERLHAGAQDRAVRLAVGHYGAHDWFADFYTGWQERGSAVHVYLRADAQRDPLAALRDGLVDLVLVPYHPQEAEYLAKPLFEDELVFICAAADPLAQKAQLEGGDLSGRAFLTYTRVVVPDQEYERFIRPSGAKTDRWVDMEEPRVITELVARGRGVSILSRWFVQDAVLAGRIAAVRIGPEGLPIKWCAVCRAEAEQDAQLMEVVDQLKRVFEANQEARSGD